MDSIYYIQYETFKRNTAAFKAPDDIYNICKDNGFHKISMPEFPLGKGKLYSWAWLLTKGVAAWVKLGRTTPKGSIVFAQHPQPGKRLVLHFVKMYRKKGIKFIVLIHDLESLRGGMKGVVDASKRTSEIGDNDMLKQFDAIICHNQHMKEYLISKGFEEDKLVNLDIFDYLSNANRIQPSKSVKPTIAVAGNLAKVKAGYIHKLFNGGHNNNLRVNLYGTRYEPEGINHNLIYHGEFAPEELANHLEGDFGLVWDGQETSTCAGNTGEYLKYNNPHKASMYLSAGMPVIVWSQAAIADFVIDNGVGIVVDNLYSLDKAINSITDEKYEEIVLNVKNISLKLSSGFYTKKAIMEAIEKCE